MKDLRDRLESALGAAYTFERELGGGGMSRIFLAEERELGRHVVMKVLNPDLAAGVSAERFRREIQLVARLQHPHIVPVLAAGDAHGILYYTMPFVEGETLRARLSRTGEMSVQETTRILREVARALAYAHKRDIVHRDIKPENILLGEDGAMVADFGVAKALTAAATREHGLTTVGFAIGTPAYMAPEQAAADPLVDQRADIYALGVVAYEMLAGTAPFAGRPSQAILAAHAAEAPEPLQRRRPSVPRPLAQLVMRSLEKRPGDRPQSADEFIQSLDVVGTSTALPAVAPPSSSKRRVAVAIAVVLALVILGAIGAVMLRSRHAAPIEQNAIIVLPFRVAGGDSSTRMLREGMLDLVSADLTGRIHAIDTRTVLNAWRRAGGSAANDLPQDAAQSLARSLGAGAVMQGEILASGPALTINGTLLDARGPSALHAKVSGASSAIASLVDSLVEKLVALRAGENEQRLSSLSGVPIDALQSYLAGQSLYRRGQFQEAGDAFARALAADSSFALAGLYVYVISLNWTSDPRGTPARVAAARHVDRLNDRDRLLLGSIDQPARPRSCGDRLRDQERATQLAPDMPETWYQLGETLAHCGQAMGIEDAWTRALQAFNRTLALDSSFAPALEHLPVIYTSLGDSVNALRTFRIWERDSVAEDLDLYRLFGPAPVDMQLVVQRVERAPARDQRAAIAVALTFAMRLDEAEQLLAHLKASAVTSAERERAAQLEMILAYDRGQPTRAAAAARVVSPEGDPALELLAAALWDGDTAVVAGARSRTIASLGTAPPTESRARGDWSSDVFALAATEMLRGDTTHARAAIAALRAVPAPADSQWLADRPHHMAMLLDAQYASLAHRADAPSTIAAADSMLREAPGGGYVESVGNLILSSLWERSGDRERAYGATMRYRVGTAPVLFLSTYLRERGRLGALTGHGRDAIEAYRRYLDLRRVAEPRLASHIAAVRRELESLERANAGR